MASSSQVSQRHTTAAQRDQGAGAVERRPRDTEAPAMRPPVDIYEDENGITLRADMPGVSKDRLDVRVERESLIIEGAVQIDMPEGMAAIYADVRSTQYRRSFALSRELDPEHIEATVKDGVLTVRVPKREEVRPRKIKVQTL